MADSIQEGRGRVSIMREYCDLIDSLLRERSAEISETGLVRELRVRKTKLAKNAVTARRYASVLNMVRDRMVAEVTR